MPLFFFLLGQTTIGLAQTGSNVILELVKLKKITGLGAQCMPITYTGTTVRTVKNGLHQYTFHAESRLNLTADSKGLAGRFKVAFSDRNGFKGAKDDTGIDIKVQGTQIEVEVTLHRWGGGKFKLSNVKATKEKHGYWLTGEYKEGRSTTYCTIAIHSYGCGLH